MRKKNIFDKKIVLLFFVFALFLSMPVYGHDIEQEHTMDFPRSESTYDDDSMENLIEILEYRLEVEPFNRVALVVFVCAIAHTLMSSFFIKSAHKREAYYQNLIKHGLADKNSHSIGAGLLHLLGEVEVVFGIWAVVLGIFITSYYSWDTFVQFLNSIHYTEPLFIVVIMTIASSRPIIKFFETITGRLVKLFGDTIEVWWLTILIVTPLLGSLITEPAAMTIAAFLISEKFYQFNPSRKLRYATLALLFFNVSIGGALTNFASPPILMVAKPWSWSTGFMLTTFGWKAVVIILLSTGSYFFLFKHEIKALEEDYQHYLYKRNIQSRFVSAKELEENFTQLANIVNTTVGFTSELDAYSNILKENLEELALKRLTKDEIVEYDIRNAIDEKFEGIQLEEMKKILPGLLPEEERPQYRDPNWNQREGRVPTWIIVVHVFFLLWTIIHARNPVLFMSGFLFFLGFFQVTAFYQNRIDLKPALLVAFFLAGIMIHGRLQDWWIGPLLGNLPATILNMTSIGLTAFNDNAAITFLSTFVKDFPDPMKYAVVSGAITGGGLTLIANSPNPVGLSILKKHFKSGVSAGMLLKYALLPTVIGAIFFLIFQ